MLAIRQCMCSVVQKKTNSSQIVFTMLLLCRAVFSFFSYISHISKEEIKSPTWGIYVLRAATARDAKRIVCGVRAVFS